MGRSFRIIFHAWRQRARVATVLLMLALAGGLALGLLAAGLIVVVQSYAWTVSVIPWPALVLPVHIAAGLVLALVAAALIKPFVRIRSNRSCAIELRRDNERELFDFVDYVCEITGVSGPTSIVVDMSASVRAGVRPGAALTIGLPVLASVSTADLGGLVARALALHARGETLDRYIAGVVLWLNHVVHGRDRLDEALERGLRSANGLHVRVARPLSAALTMSRRLLARPLDRAMVASAGAMRRIEAQGDDRQAEVIGAQRFAGSVHRTRLLRFTLDRSESALRAAWRSGTSLPAELPQALASRLHAHARLPGRGRVLAVAEAEQETIASFHVPDARRIDRIRQTGAEPAIACTHAARKLVRGFTLLSRRLTLLHYRNTLRLPVTPMRLQHPPVPDRDVLEAFCGHAWFDEGFVAPGRFLERARTTGELVSGASRLAEVIAAAGGKARKLIDRHSDVHNLLVHSLLEELELRAGRATWRSRKRLEAVQTRCRALEDGLEVVCSGIDAHAELMSRRLAAGMLLLERPETAARLAGARTLAVRAFALADVLDRLQPQMRVLREMRIHAAVLELLLAGRRTGGALKDRIAEQEAELAQRLVALRVALKHVRHPLREDISLFDDVHAGWVATTPDYEALEEASVVLEGLLRVRANLTAQLILWVESAEDAWKDAPRRAASM